MKDGIQLKSIAETIWKVCPGAKIYLKTNAPVCSKTIAFLKNLSIEISKL